MSNRKRAYQNEKEESKGKILPPASTTELDSKEKGRPVQTITKAHIVDDLYAKGLFSKRECFDIIEGVFETMKKSLESGEDIMISGFGKFQILRKHQRRGRNPYTGESITLEPRTVVTFKCSRKLRDDINGD